MECRHIRIKLGLAIGGPCVFHTSMRRKRMLLNQGYKLSYNNRIRINYISHDYTKCIIYNLYHILVSKWLARIGIHNQVDRRKVEDSLFLLYNHNTSNCFHQNGYIKGDQATVDILSHTSGDSRLESKISRAYSHIFHVGNMPPIHHPTKVETQHRLTNCFSRRSKTYIRGFT